MMYHLKYIISLTKFTFNLKSQTTLSLIILLGKQPHFSILKYHFFAFQFSDSFMSI